MLTSVLPLKASCVFGKDFLTVKRTKKTLNIPFLIPDDIFRVMTLIEYLGIP